MPYQRDLSESNEARMLDAARALMAAVYDPLDTQANWPGLDDLGPMAFDRVMKITALAVANIKNQEAPGSVNMHDAGFMS